MCWSLFDRYPAVVECYTGPLAPCKLFFALVILLVFLGWEFFQKEDHLELFLTPVLIYSLSIILVCLVLWNIMRVIKKSLESSSETIRSEVYLMIWSGGEVIIGCMYLLICFILKPDELQFWFITFLSGITSFVYSLFFTFKLPPCHIDYKKHRLPRNVLFALHILFFGGSCYIHGYGIPHFTFCFLAAHCSFILFYVPAILDFYIVWDDGLIMGASPEAMKISEESKY